MQMISVAMHAMNADATERDESMVVIVVDWEVLRLTNNASFDAFEEQKLLKLLRSPRLIFAHGYNAI